MKKFCLKTINDRLSYIQGNAFNCIHGEAKVDIGVRSKQRGAGAVRIIVVLVFVVADVVGGDVHGKVPDGLGKLSMTMPPGQNVPIEW